MTDPLVRKERLPRTVDSMVKARVSINCNRAEFEPCHRLIITAVTVTTQSANEKGQINSRKQKRIDSIQLSWEEKQTSSDPLPKISVVPTGGLGLGRRPEMSLTGQFWSRCGPSHH